MTVLFTLVRVVESKLDRICVRAVEPPDRQSFTYLHQIITANGEVIQRHRHRKVVVSITPSFPHRLAIGAHS